MGVNTHYIEHCPHWENGYDENSNGKLHDGLLDREIFYTLREAQVLTAHYRQSLQPDTAL